jgi:peptide/nickel transport system permease protein
MPEFWLGIMLLIAFGVGVGSFPGLFPTGGLSSPNTELASMGGIWDVARHLFLPCLTLTLAYIAEYALVMRSSLLDELGEDYLTTARAKGLREALVLRRHAVPNALLPTTTLIFLNPLLQGVFLLFSAAVIIANLVADLLYAYLDPRVRTG